MGEEGFLEEVQLRHDLRPQVLILVANHLGDIRKGIMVLEDTALLKAVYTKLRQHLGRSLTEIGDLELTLFPPVEKRGFKQARPPTPLLPKSAAE